MRMSWLDLRRRRDDEEGAVVMIVAICMIVLLGMLVLVVDLGRVVAVRRDMVNASDSAVLAAAQTCARGGGSGAARTAADTLIDENTTNLNPTTMTGFNAPECDSLDNTDLKFVTVTSQTRVDYFFAQIFGLESTKVNTAAEAAWGPAIGVSNPAPLRLLSSAVNGCLAQPVGDTGPECAFGFDNTDQNSQSSSQWGILNFPEGWPTAPPNPMECESQAGGANDVIDYLSGAVGDFTPVLWALPAPVYVCAEGGLSANTMNWMIDWLIANIGNPLIFPVMADPAQWPPVLTSGGESYPIIGFVSLSVMGAWRGQQARDNCEFEANNASVFCIQLRHDEVVIVPGVPGSGAYYDQTQAIRLVE